MDNGKMDILPPYNKPTLYENCLFCGRVPLFANKHDESSVKHICNKVLYKYYKRKKKRLRNNDCINITCYGERENTVSEKSLGFPKPPESEITSKNRIFVLPNQQAKFTYSIKLVEKTTDPDNENVYVKLVYCQLLHPQPLFNIGNNKNGSVLRYDTSVDIIVTFRSKEVGQYSMPIAYTFEKNGTENIVIVRDMLVIVQEERPKIDKKDYPYKELKMNKSENFVKSTNQRYQNKRYSIPADLKNIFAFWGHWKDIKCSQKKAPLNSKFAIVREIFNTGAETDKDYPQFFQHLLWYEEVIARINLKKYTMSEVPIEKNNKGYILEVPGLAENRPSLLRGDYVFIQPCESLDYTFEGAIKDIEENQIIVSDFGDGFDRFYYKTAPLFNVRFSLSRLPYERMHDAVMGVIYKKQLCRIFPKDDKNCPKIKPINTFFNKNIKNNEEQKKAVERILSRSSGIAPYMVFGPPGTGKTMTIVEAILQIVVNEPSSRVLVCTDSNMAADHIALALLRYNMNIAIPNFIFRANSQTRAWNVMPPELKEISNGTDHKSFYPLSISKLKEYRIIVATHMHVAKYGSYLKQTASLEISDLFIDEAAQASEPATLIPITGLLSINGRLVLAGDPLQLGPVCVSKNAKRFGLGVSLMERLRNKYVDLYEDNPNFITMLLKNFRSDPRILKIPNELFYRNSLQPQASKDELSDINILQKDGGEGAVVFHAVESKEQRLGKAPSFFNDKEIEIVKKYVKALLNEHKVQQKDIGIIVPYVRQVYKIKGWLLSERYDSIEIGSVEAFQGKEKRIVLITTVRANSNLLDYDAKYDLGFLVDDKRFNVAVTRAKAKLVIIGNPACLRRDYKWRLYMDYCKQLSSYYGIHYEQLTRTSELLYDVAVTRFDSSRITEILEVEKNTKKQKN